MYLKHYSFLGLAFFCVQCLCAQQPVNDSIRISEITISGMHINDSLLNAPAAIGILSKNDLRRNNMADISTAINLVPGVYMQSSNITTTRISIRGIGARTTYGTNKIRAFYGSIPLTSGDAETIIDDIDVENIEQVEIIKGPLSSIYGAGLGGAVLISPLLSEGDGNNIRVSSVYGSYGLAKTNVGYSLNKKTASLNISYHKLETEGWRTNSSYNREGTTLAGELFRRKNSKLTYFGNFTHLYAFIPSSIDKKTFDENPRAAAPTWMAAKGYKKYESVLGGVSYDWRILDHLKNATSVYLNYKNNYEPRPFDILGQFTFATGARTQFSGDFHIGKIKSEVNAGLEYFKDDYHGRTSQNLYQENDGKGTLEGYQLTGSRQKRSFCNAFAQMRLQFSRKFEFQAGLNYNQTQFDLDNNFPSDAAVSDNYRYDGIWSPQASFLFKPTNRQTVYVSVSRGFSLPSVDETLTASGSVNPEIRPETGYNYELGGKFYFFNRHLYADIALFRMDIDNLLVAERIGDDQYVGINAGETTHQGLEVSVNYQWQLASSVFITPYAAASIGDYKFDRFNDHDNDFSGNKLTGVPANTANAGMTFSSGIGIFLTGDFRFVDKIPLNDANTVYADAYRLLDLKAGYRFEILQHVNIQFAAGVNNVTDEHYASLILPNATAFGKATPRYYYPGLPINYYGNVAVNYHF